LAGWLGFLSHFASRAQRFLYIRPLHDRILPTATFPVRFYVTPPLAGLAAHKLSL
jgi:hypothetical protein